MTFTGITLRHKFSKDKDSEKLCLDKFLENPPERYKIYAKMKDDTIEKRIANAYEKYGKEYKSYVKKIPMLIKTNGLGATFAFTLSKAKDGNAHELIYRQTAYWVMLDAKGLFSLTNPDDFVAEIVKLESVQYRAVTIEVLAFFNWLKRFAEGLIEGEADE